MNNSDYWKQRFEQLENKRHNQSLELSGEIKNIFEKTQKSLENQIELWYRRLADNNGISIAEARKMLSKKELMEFKWDVNQYIRHGENNTDGQWNRQLENASARFHISRLEALEIYIQQQLESLYAEYESRLTDDLKSTYEDDYLHTAYELQKGTGIGAFIAKPDKNVVEKLLLKPWAEDGYNFSERIWRDKQKLISVAFAEITKNILTGQNPQKAIDAIAKKMNTSKYNAGRLVMTEEAYFSSLATGESYKAHGYEQYQILATLDNRTSEICQQMDQKPFPVSEYRAGVTAPPFHVSCRSTTVPYDEKYSANAQRSARDPETGKTYYVPADMNYSQWKQKFVDGVDNQGNGGIIKVGSEKNMNIVIDKFTPCLENAETGEILSTGFSKITMNELSSLKGWNFNWTDTQLNNSEIYKLYINGDDTIQGLIAISDYKKDKAVYVDIAESAPHNLGKSKKYNGVGGHLFAIAAKISVDKGYGGFVFMDAKNKGLVSHYQKTLGAFFLGRPHPYRMFIDEEQAKKLLQIYTLKEE